MYNFERQKTDDLLVLCLFQNKHERKESGGDDHLNSIDLLHVLLRVLFVFYSFPGLTTHISLPINSIRLVLIPQGYV